MIAIWLQLKPFNSIWYTDSPSIMNLCSQFLCLYATIQHLSYSSIIWNHLLYPLWKFILEYLTFSILFMLLNMWKRYTYPLTVVLLCPMKIFSAALWTVIWKLDPFLSGLVKWNKMKLTTLCTNSNISISLKLAA